MSTFYGGSQLVGVTSLSATSGTYTVPAGHYAEVDFLLRFVGGNSGEVARISLNSFTLAEAASGGNEKSGLITVTSGTTVALFLTGVSPIATGYVGIKIYKNP